MRQIWAVVFDRGRVLTTRPFLTREEAIVFATIHMSADRVEIVEACSDVEAENAARLQPRHARNMSSNDRHR